ncbi:Bug family tripartite tricarboxylate transporter substrate binding protein [Pararhodobacter sp.]|uniref:Bug family tripartite tricarboxylate transporter substrate binding protein n=1 Tax=Pararhodobacter sp. TaxID=2127056 RepID=UPI002FDEB546
MQTRRMMVKSIWAAALTAVLASGAAAQSFPDGPVTMIVPYAPGGPTDLMARFVAQRLSENWGHPVLVENRPGASGTLGSDHVARSDPDGYTLVVANNAAQGAYELLNPSTTPYQTLEAFAPVAMVSLAPLVMIVPSSASATTLAEFVEWAAARPGEVNYASAAVGSATHLASIMLSEMAGLDMEMIVFQGAAPALQAVVAGETDMYAGGFSTVAGQVEANTVRALGVMAPQRLGAAPDLPTFAEQGYDIDYGSWFGLMAPAATPGDILDQINADVATVLSDDTAREALANYGMELMLTDRATFGEMIQARIDLDRRLIAEAGMETN